MIVLDEHLQRDSIREGIARWYRGAIVNLTDLRPHTNIKDDAVPSLLRTVHDPTFVTIDVDGFWRKVDTDNHYGIVCFDLPDVRTVPPLLRQIFSLGPLRTRANRLGKIVLVSPTAVHCYTDRTQRPFLIER